MNNSQDHQNLIDTKVSEPIFRMLKKSDIQDVLKLMAEIKPNIGGVRYPSLYNALCNDALFDKRIVFTVAEEQSKIIGFFFGIIDRNSWRFSFMVRHPIIGTRMVFIRTFERLSILVKKFDSKTINLEPYNTEINKFITSGTTSRSWDNDSSPQIAKLLYGGVSGTHRGKNIAKRLGEYICKVLAERGVRRVDATIVYNNIKGIRLDHGLGFTIYRTGYSFFATKDVST